METHSSCRYNQDSNSLLNNQLFQQTVSPQSGDNYGKSTLIDNTDEQHQIHLKFFEQYKKIYVTSYKLHKEIYKQVELKDVLLTRFIQLETQINNLHKNKRVEEVEDESLQENSGTRERERRKNAKRMRRTAEEIERKYYCSAQHCDRCYGSQGSLQQHIKLKHPEIYKKEDEY